MNVFRIHICPKGGEPDKIDPFQYCIDNHVLGLGWPVGCLNSGASWEDYEREAIGIYEKDSKLLSVRILKNSVKVDDLIWTRNKDGEYYLARVLSGWEYYSIDEAIKADIVNVVRCEIKKVKFIDEVPGKVIACFRSPRTIQTIRDTTVLEYSQYLWNKMTNTNTYQLIERRFDNIYSYLSAEEAEDVIFVYLQIEGWVIIPNSRKTDTMAYEYYAINKKTGKKALVQVKTGDVKLSPKDWEHWEEKVYLFQANGKYDGLQGDNVECLQPEAIKSFMYENKDILPSSIVHWLEVADAAK